MVWGQPMGFLGPKNACRSRTKTALGSASVPSAWIIVPRGGWRWEEEEGERLTFFLSSPSSSFPVAARGREGRAVLEAMQAGHLQQKA